MEESLGLSKFDNLVQSDPILWMIVLPRRWGRRESVGYARVVAVATTKEINNWARLGFTESLATQWVPYASSASRKSCSECVLGTYQRQLNNPMGYTDNLAAGFSSLPYYQVLRFLLGPIIDWSIEQSFSNLTQPRCQLTTCGLIALPTSSPPLISPTPSLYVVFQERR